MSERTPSEALSRYLSPTRSALNCMTSYRFALRERNRIAANTIYPVGFVPEFSVSLRGNAPLSFSAGQLIRIEHVDERSTPGDRFRVALVAHYYEFATLQGQEVLSFHWAPESPDPAAIRFPHAHIGPAITAGQAAVRPGDLHRAHIPTGVISLPAVIRLAIAEFGVFPLQEDWAARLAAAEAVLSAEPHG